MIIRLQFFLLKVLSTYCILLKKKKKKGGNSVMYQLELNLGHGHILFTLAVKLV